MLVSYSEIKSIHDNSINECEGSKKIKSLNQEERKVLKIVLSSIKKGKFAFELEEGMREDFANLKSKLSSSDFIEENPSFMQKIWRSIGNFFHTRISSESLIQQIKELKILESTISQKISLKKDKTPSVKTPEMKKQENTSAHNRKEDDREKKQQTLFEKDQDINHPDIKEQNISIKNQKAENKSEEPTHSAFAVSGIRTIGNFCYGNACLQTFLNHPKIETYLSQKVIQLEDELDEHFSSREVFRDTLKEWHTSYKQGLSPEENAVQAETLRDIATELNPDIRNAATDMQDAAAFFEVLLNVLNYELKNEITRTDVESGGILSQRDDVQNILQPSLNAGTLQLQQMVDHLFAIETEPRDPYRLTYEENGKPVTLTYTNYTIQSSIISPPPELLILQLTRSVGDTRPVEFPRDNIVNFSHAFKDEELVQYSVSGVIVHLAETKHYISYVKKGDDWFCCDDSSIRKVTLAEVNDAKSKAYFVVLDKFPVRQEK